MKRKKENSRIIWVRMLEGRSCLKVMMAVMKMMMEMEVETMNQEEFSTLEAFKIVVR
jgi:hypothetical protein